MFLVLNRNKHKCTKSMLAVIGKVLCFALFLSISVSAKSLEEYKENINTLKNQFAAMRTDGHLESKKDVLENVSKLLLATETIEVGDASLEVNNKWIETEISKYKTKTDKTEKLQIVNAIYERLESIEIKIKELEKTTESNVSKDEQKRKLAEILSREEYQKPNNEETSLLQRLIDWINNWLNQYAPKPKKQLPTSNFSSVLPILQIILLVVVIGVIIFLLYKFGPFLLKKFRERERKNTNERIILGEKISADETSSNLFSDAEKLALEGNLRDAIRKGYVAFLFELSERKLIGLAKHKTNQDYLKAVRKKKDLYENMNGLTLNYERHWYGFEDADEKDWQAFREDYEEALKKR